MKLRLTIFLAGVLTLALPALAIRAKRDVRTVTQPDGTTINIKVVGDEHMHFTVSEDGMLLQKDEQGFYTYASIAENGMIEATSMRYTPGLRTAEAVRLSDIDLEQLQLKRNARRRSAPQSGMGLSSTTYPRTGSPKGLIILVQYSDVKFTLSNPASYFKDMINGSNFTQYGGTGSALQYFTEQSGGKFQPSFDVYGPVTLPNKMSYYGGNDHWGDDMYPHHMVTHAIDILDSTVDFSQYDTDGDGLIDNVYIFYAGQGEASYGSENTVWPHSWDVREAGVTKKVDGVIVGHYACSNEWEYNRPDGVGTFVHEFSHVMGLPDLYNTVADVYYTPGEYSVLDYGPYNNDGRTPPNYSAYELNALGWFEPIMMDGPMEVSLQPVSSGQFGLIQTSKNTEFFLFENRQLEGWDKYIPNHGMLIWHIDYVESVFENNVVNNTRNHQYVDIEEANNNPDGSSLTTMQGWTFPGTSKKTSFTSLTTPALKEWSGKGIDLPVTEISENAGIISFKVAGGAAALSRPNPYVDGVTDIGYFVARWDAVDGATDYYLTVYAEGKGNKGEVSTGFNNSSPGTGWTASSTGYYETDGNYGESSPSFKFSKTNQTLTSPVVDGDVTSVSFWVKGQGNDTGTYLVIDGLVGNTWVSIDKCVPTMNKATSVEITNVPSGVKQVRFSMTKATGNIAIDDVVVTYEESAEILPDYNGVSTNGETTVKVDKLKEGVEKYSFTVQATDGKQLSEVSERIPVTVTGLSGVENIIVEENISHPVEYYTLQGTRIVNPMPGTVVIRRHGTDVSKIIIH